MAGRGGDGLVGEVQSGRGGDFPVTSGLLSNYRWQGMAFLHVSYKQHKHR